MTVTLGRAGQPQPVARMSVEDYLRFEELSEVRHDYVDGLLYPVPGTSKRHNLIVGRLYRRLAEAAEQSGHQVFFETVKVRPQPDLFYYPDLMVVKEDVEEDYFSTSPCLLVEVLSAGTLDKDRREKWLAYKQIAALEAYLLVYQDERRVDVFARQGEAWQLYELTEGAIGLSCPPVTLELDAIYQGML